MGCAGYRLHACYKNVGVVLILKTQSSKDSLNAGNEFIAPEITLSREGLQYSMMQTDSS